MSGASGWRPHIEWALTLGVGSLFKAGALQPNATTSGGWQWHSDSKKVASVHYTATLQVESGELRLAYTWTHDGEPLDVTCLIRLSSLPLHYGGDAGICTAPIPGGAC